ncbi:MAG: hypothetical protein L3K26_18130 [Candidatus Hydrogenedentes bacterium]|nr:hypothetical protein [Candidatus Hydrogenedentota bacterium]
MADDTNNPEENQDNLDTPGDSGLGNLPPLSDFDSGGMDSDGGLPPLGGFDSGGTPVDSAGLPPISDIQVETPQPTGGNVKPAPPGFDSAVTDTFSSGTPGIDTPAGQTPSEGLSPVGSGFQDLAADSDFSPETPEIGPGPDSNVDTPMFDSAFGGGSGSGFGSGTGAPTQAMETPMFGQAPAGDQPGFDAGAFGAGGGAPDFAAGTPAPDFSPDTDMRAPVGGGMPSASEPGAGGKGGSKMALVIAAVVALVIGIAAPYIPGVSSVLPNPMKEELQTASSQVSTLQADVSAKQREIDRLKKAGGEDGVTVSPEEEKRLTEAVLGLNEKLKLAEAELTDKTKQLAARKTELDTKNDEYLTIEDKYDTLKSEFSITQARQRGLVSEVDRLTSQVGALEVADARRSATKSSLEHAVDRLYIQVKEGLPLTPEKYARNARIAAVESLREQLSGSKWVTPALQEAYTSLYLKELSIAQSQEYFYSKIPVIDSYGSRVLKWAECVMNGNQGVSYRTFDGKNIGVFSNQGTGENPAWGFMEGLIPVTRKEIENKIIASRVEGFEEKIQALAERQLAMEDGSGFQRAFSSL